MFKNSGLKRTYSLYYETDHVLFEFVTLNLRELICQNTDLTDCTQAGADR